MAEGNRKDPRARVLNMTVRYKSATVDEFIENHSHDISRGGIFIKTRAPFPAGTLLKFEVRIAEDQRLMQGVGRVVWRREPERAEEGSPAGMGIKFIKTGEGAAELIAQIVDARQGEESSFDAGARQNGADADEPRSQGARHPAVAITPEVSDAPHPDTPSLQVDSAPTSLPTEGELRVSSPAKKRTAASETRKVVLQGAAVEGPASDKPSSSTRARAVAAQAAAERAPSRPAAAAKGRNSLADETTSPRVRASKSALAAAQPSNTSRFGLVAIVGVVGAGLLIFKLARSPEEEPAAPPPLVSAAPTPAPVRPSPPATALPSAAAPAAETGEGAGEPSLAAKAPSAPTTVVPAPAASAGAAAKPSAATSPGSATPGSATPASAAPGSATPGSAAPGSAAPGSAAPGSATPHAAASAAAASTSVPVTPPAAAKPAPAAAPSPPKPPLAAAPAVATKPKVAPKPAPAANEALGAVRPSTPAGEPGSAGAANAAEARPGEPAKKRPPAAAAPTEPEPPKAAPNPKSDDNPY